MNSATWRTTSSGPCGRRRAWTVLRRADMGTGSCYERSHLTPVGLRRTRAAGGARDQPARVKCRLHVHGTAAQRVQERPAGAAAHDAAAAARYPPIRREADPYERESG